MLDRYDAFLSYSHCYRGWVEVLHRNLERCLRAAGRAGRIFVDDADLVSGRSWITQLQQGLDRSEQVVLVATPEALASERVADEWESLIAGRPDWRNGRLHLAMLVETPLPLFLEPIQYVDFQEAGEERYRQGLRKLLAGLLGGVDGRGLPELAADLEVPEAPVPGLPTPLRRGLVGWLAPVLEKPYQRAAVATYLGIPPSRLDGQASSRCAASAALVWATGGEAPGIAALRVVDRLLQGFEGYDREALAALAALREELLKLQATKPEEGLIDRWLRQVARDHERLVPLQERAELGLLDRVYVQLEVRPDVRRAAETKDGPRLDRPLSLLELVSLKREEAPWVTGRWVVLGDPGSGKTTLLRHLTRALALDEGRPWVPLFDSLPRLLRDRHSLLDRAARRLERAAGQTTQGLGEALKRAGEEGRLLLLLDGLDEVPREDREEAEQLLRDLAGQWPRTPLVVTSRPIGYRRPGSEFREVDLLPLDRVRRGELLANWFGYTTGVPDAARAERALRVLDAPELRELAGNPLYLTLMALLFKQEVEPDRNRTRLYDQVFDLLLAGKHREGAQPMERKDVVRAVLRIVACGMTEDNRDAEPLDSLEDRLYRPELEGLRKKLEQVGRWRHGLRTFLDEVAEQSGILGPHDGPGADWRFWHRTFREALTAERLAEEYRQEDGRAKIVAKAKKITAEDDLSRWAEPFALLAGRVPDPDELVLDLVRANRPLGLRALATAQRLKDETVKAALALSEKWQERAQVYGELAGLVGDPGRALGLLDELRRRTRNGNDLYFLHQAAVEIGRSSPEHGREAERIASGLYGHLGRPPEELFRWVETPRDGRIELWKPIPAGTFWMGSPEGESKWDDERPRHRVTLTSPFRIGAVPVTHGQYLLFDPEHRSSFEGRVPAGELARHPVDGVTWYAAVSFCRWLSWAFPWARGARLPAEEEWEHACRAGTETRYWKGDQEEDLAEVGWYDKNSGGRTHQVGEKAPNPWGLYDVHGNVYEWTLSPWVDSYAGREGGVIHDPAAVDVQGTAHGVPGSAETSSGVRRVLRGGSFRFVAVRARAAYRYGGIPGFMVEYQGFRVVLPGAPELGP